MFVAGRAEAYDRPYEAGEEIALSTLQSIPIDTLANLISQRRIMFAWDPKAPKRTPDWIEGDGDEGDEQSTKSRRSKRR